MDRLKFAFLSREICREVAPKLNEVQGFSIGAFAYLLYTTDLKCGSALLWKGNQSHAGVAEWQTQRT
jgi:hypothetical protein